MDILDQIWKVRNPKDALFLELISGYKIKESKYSPDNIFYIKNDITLINYDKVTKATYINYDLIWKVFKIKFSLKHIEMKELMKDMLDKHLNLIETKPFLVPDPPYEENFEYK